jgi:hypothetical protein
MSSFAACLALSACAIASDAGPTIPSSEFEGPERQAAAAVSHYLKLVKAGRMEEVARMTGAPCNFVAFDATDRKQVPGMLAKGGGLLRDLATVVPDPVELVMWGTVRDQKSWRPQQRRIDAVLRPSDYCVRMGGAVVFLVRMDGGVPVVVGMAEEY